MSPLFAIWRRCQSFSVPLNIPSSSFLPMTLRARLFIIMVKKDFNGDGSGKRAAKRMKEIAKASDKFYLQQMLRRRLLLWFAGATSWQIQLRISVALPASVDSNIDRLSQGAWQRHAWFAVKVSRDGSPYLLFSTTSSPTRPSISSVSDS